MRYFLVLFALIAAMALAGLTGTRSARAVDPLPTVTPLPTLSILPSPEPSPSPSDDGSSGGSTGGSTGGSGGGSGGGSATSGTGGITSTGITPNVTTPLHGGDPALAARAPNSRHELGEGTGGCGSPSPVLLGQLAREEPAPPFVLPEPPGMDGPQSTTTLGNLLIRAHRRTGMPLSKGFLKVAGPFPVAGPASWSNDWHAFRPCPYPHLHEGLDIFSQQGTPLVAVARGVVTEVGTSSTPGNYVEIRNAGGTEFFYAHLSAFAKRLHEGQRVHQGQVVGYMGNTGNARGTSPHLHLEVQPGGVPTPPKPFVDRWLLTAIRQARAMATGQDVAQLTSRAGASAVAEKPVYLNDRPSQWIPSVAAYEPGGVASIPAAAVQALGGASSLPAAGLVVLFLGATFVIAIRTRALPKPDRRSKGD
jgi:murein DD-endopeptidase MepM/ murein hydrolase activator NlpD